MTDQRLTAEQVLQILNDGQPVDLDQLTLAIITDGAGPDRDRYTTYELGEILVVDRKDRREPFGEGRKPWKVDVGAHFTTDWDAAHALSSLVRDPHLQPGVYVWDGEEWTPSDREWEFDNPTVADPTRTRPVQE
jgi:hypothetical protein